MKHVETFLILQFEVRVITLNQHVDDIVVVSRYCVMQRRVSYHVLYKHSLALQLLSTLPNRSKQNELKRKSKFHSLRLILIIRISVSVGTGKCEYDLQIMEKAFKINRNNSGADCSISLRPGTDFDHVTSDVQQMLKVKCQRLRSDRQSIGPF